LSASVTAGPAGGLAPPTLPTPAVLSANGTATASLGLSALTVGTYTVNITATSGALVHSTTVTVTVPTPNFSIAVSPTSRSVTRGSSTTYTVTITRTAGFIGDVTLSVTGQTSRDTASFSVKTLGSGATTSVLTIKTSTQDSRGTRTLTINGVSGTLSHSVTASLALR
jgi:hypothetical protein